MKIAPGSRLLFIGDSVTDVGRARPVAQGLFNPLGTGYPNIVNEWLFAFYPERRIHVINMGNSGNNIRDLKSRWQTDVFDLKPDWVSVCIGINDVWRQFDSKDMPETHVLPQEYESVYRELIEKTLPVLKGGMVIITPHYLEPNRDDAMRKRMDEYGEICRRLAHEYGTVFVDSQAAFDAALRHCHSAFIAWDRVHPNNMGHAVTARAFMKALDCGFAS